MMVLDTNVLSELMREAPSPAVVIWLARQDVTRIRTTAINSAEILAGIAVLPEGRRRAGLLSAAHRMFSEDFANRLLPFDQKAAPYYAEILAARQNLGRRIEPLDAMIAAVARAFGAAVATRNVSDFDDCGITLHDPWSEFVG